MNRQTTFTYNGAGQPVTVTDPLNQTTQLAYDLGDLVSVTNPLGFRTTRFVDAAGRVLTVTDALGNLTRSEYDALNRVTRVTDALGGPTTFTYDANSNLLTLMDARNNTTTYTYDVMDRVATRADPLQRQESYLYDNNGNLRQLTDRKNQVTTYTYDSLDRPTQVAYADTSTTGFTYDGGDRQTQVVDSLAGTITRSYDLLDRPTGETTPEGTVNYTYDAANRRATMMVVGQTAVSYAYNNADDLTGITQRTASVGFTYDTAGRRASLTLPNGILVEYAYDTASQLTGLTYKLGQNTLGALTYTYDATGSRTAVGGTWARTGLPAALASATYDAANQLTLWGGTAVTYDANGSLTSDGSRTHTWNARNQLVGLSGGVTASFSYDGLGRRRAKTVSGSTTQFLYEGLNPVQELSGGTPTANLLTGLGIDEVFARTASSATHSFLADALGGTVALADAAGAVQTQYTYEPFGATTSSGPTNSNSLQFAGRENDGTGLFYYRARYYHPGLQRFVSEDPIGFRAGVNVFAYAVNRPTVFVDPLGLDVINKTPRTIWVKPERGSIAVPVPPGQSFLGPQDGFADPRFPNRVYKTPNGMNVVVNPDGSVTPYPFWWRWLRRWIEQPGRGGWQDLDWLKQLWDKKPVPDRTWDDLFDKSKPPPGRKDEPSDSGSK